MIGRVSIAVLTLASLATMVAARTVRAESYNEAIFGDLSSDPANPDPIPLNHGFNVITGSVGDGDIDVLKLTMPSDHHLQTLVLGAYAGPSMSFMGLQIGSVWTAGTGGAVNPASLLGWTHFGTAAPGAGVNDDLLDDLGTPKQGSAGFTPPLWPNTFAMLLQDTGAAVNYSIRFNLVYNGDFNLDGFVTPADIVKWNGDFGLNAASTADPDFDSDGTDFLIWQQALQPLNAISAPEPSCLALASLAAAFGATRRRRRAA